jgi:hypothetical protein
MSDARTGVPGDDALAQILDNSTHVSTTEPPRRLRAGNFHRPIGKFGQSRGRSETWRHSRGSSEFAPVRLNLDTFLNSRIG